MRKKTTPKRLVYTTTSTTTTTTTTNVHDEGVREESTPTDPAAAITTVTVQEFARVLEWIAIEQTMSTQDIEMFRPAIDDMFYLCGSERK
jgi:hypothetical protein